MIYYREKKLKKRLHVLKAYIIMIKKYSLDVSDSKIHFLQDMFQMTTIAVVSVINHYPIYGLRHIYIYIYIYNEKLKISVWNILVKQSKFFGIE